MISTDPWNDTRTYPERMLHRLLAIPRQLSAEAVGLDAGQVEALFETAIRSALGELRAGVGGVELLDEVDE